MSKQSANAADLTATRDYIVLRGRLEKAGTTYPTGAIVPLTDAEAMHPLTIGVVRLKDVETGKAGE